MQSVAAPERQDGMPACVVHVDLDGYADICRAHGWEFAGTRDPVFESGLRNALAFLAREQVEATLFTIAQDVRDAAKKELLAGAVQGGHAIGSHSTTHRKLDGLASAEKRSEIGDSRKLLEDALGIAVRGFRAPGFAMDAECLMHIEAAGYDYDSSLFPDARTARRVALPDIAKAPSKVGPAARLLELPMPAYAPLPLPFHPSYSLVLGFGYFRAGVARAQRSRSPLVLLFHLTDFADPVPPADLPNWKARVYTLSFLGREEKLRRCARMLAHVRRRYRIVSTSTLLHDVSTNPPPALAQEGP